MPRTRGSAGSGAVGCRRPENSRRHLLPRRTVSDPLIIRIHPQRRRRHRPPPARRRDRGSRAKASPSPAWSRPATRSRRAPIAAGAPVRRYDQIIGSAKQAIAAGPACPHATTSSSASFARDYAAASGAQADRVRRGAGDLRRHRPRRRPHRDAQLHRHPDLGELLGDGGARDRRPLPPRHPIREALERFPNVDGVVALTHGARLRDRQRRRAAAGAAPHARRLCAARELRLGAGRRPRLRDQPDQRPDGAGEARRRTRRRAARLQHPGHRRHEEDGRARHRARRNGCSRKPTGRRATPVPASHITVGLQCGGSDGYSGISANPALGAAVDRLVRHGGTAILSETPEIYGGEHLLTRRAVSQAGRRQAGRAHPLVGALLRAQRRGDGQQPLGRQQGGRPDDDPREEPGRDRRRAARPTWSTSSSTRSRSPRKGLVFMDTPGYDPVSATGQVAGGANLICFTTGRGSAYGCAPSPSLKLSTNTRAVDASRKTTSTSTAATSSTAR